MKVSEAARILMKLMEESANQECADCELSLLPSIRQSNVLFASLNNGVFICPKCSNLHAALGESVSLVKPISIKNIDEKEIKYFKIGGNANFVKFIKEYSLNNANLELKYKSKAGNYYRARVLLYINH